MFSRWIVEAYLKKGTEFFITNDFTIFPACDFAKHFEVSATYRIKRSGSDSVGKSKISNVMKYITDQNYPIEKFKIEGKKLFAYSATNLHNRRFIYDGYEYMFSLRGDIYEVRKLSNTFNANVIFTILKKNQNGITDTEFENFLK